MNGKLAELFALLPDYLGGHLLLAVPAIVVGVLISVPLGILAYQRSGVRGPVMTVASLAQTIPSIALLAIMVAILGGTIGYRPAFIALLVYSMLPILRNTLTALEEVDPAMREAARGVSMKPKEALLLVELPLALPVILAGIRTATVWVVGITTLSTPVGAPSLGNYIFSGLQLRDWTQVYFGCLFAMGLTLVLDQVVHLSEVAAQRRSPKLMGIAGGVLAAILIAGFMPALLDAGRRGSDTVVETTTSGAQAIPKDTLLLRNQEFKVGAKSFTEQAILAQWLADALESQGAETEILGNMGSTILFDALANNTLDVYIDYSGTIWATVMKRENPVGRTAMFIEVSHYLKEEHDIMTLGRVGFENTYCLALTRSEAERLNLRRINDLVPYLNQLTLGGDPEFFGRPEWTRVRDLYGLDGLKTRGMDATFMYQAVRDGQVDLISGFSTDGRIPAYDLVVLQDPKQAFPPYDAMILASPKASRDPALAQALQPLLHSINAKKMRAANRMVDLDKASPAEAATLLESGPLPDDQ